MSLSTLFKSNGSAHACTSEEFLKLTKKCMEGVQKRTTPRILSTSPKFNNGQCKYLADKLKLAVESAQSLPADDSANCLEIFKFLHGLAHAVENFIRNCCQDAWIQAAMMLTNASEHISSLGFNLEVLTQSFLGDLVLIGVDDIYLAETEIVEEKAAEDKETLLEVVNALLRTRTSTSTAYQSAAVLLERLQQPMPYQTGGIPRLLQVDSKSLKEMRQLGKGAFATVFKASWQGIEVAKKTFYTRDSQDFEKEVSILQGLSHPNIASLLVYAKDERECSIVMELMDEDLFHLIQKRMKEPNTRGYPFEILEAVEMMLQVGRGMQYLHQIRIVHRDLKSMNILVKYVKGRNLGIEYVLAKVSDFGLSRTKERSVTYSNQTTNMGTTRWMAPEMINLYTPERPTEISNNDALSAKYPFRSDVYSFAMVCYEILTGEMPYFEECRPNEVKKKVLKGDRPELPNRCPVGLQSLIERCWSGDASQRPCFGEICAELRHLKCSLLRARLTCYQFGPYGESYSKAIIPCTPNHGLQPERCNGARRFTIAELKRITRDFCRRHMIGAGAYGTVYQAKLRDGTSVAIKRFQRVTPHHFDRNFRAEVEMLSEVEHLNVVRLMGFAVGKNEKMVVTEYVTNGNLRQHLDGVPYGVILDLSRRLNIAIDVATALNYLHYHHDGPIIHRDVKSSNVLITDTFRAKVGGFDISRPGPIGDDTHVSTDLAGTFGYVDPEYMMTNELTLKSDVYSFGILLVELFSGRPAVDFNLSTSHAKVTQRWASQNVMEGRLKNVIDPKIQVSSSDLVILGRIFELAFCCSAPKKVDRPDMSEAKETLWNIREEYRFGSDRQPESLQAQNPEVSGR